MTLRGMENLNNILEAVDRDRISLLDEYDNESDFIHGVDYGMKLAITKIQRYALEMIEEEKK